jgi:DNA processing protein
MREEGMFLHAIAACRPFISPNRLRELIASVGSARAAWDATEERLRPLGWTDEQRARFLEHRQTWNIERETERLERSGIVLIAHDDARIPDVLTQIYDPPLALYVRGDLRADDLAVAVVGSRKATPYGKTATNFLVRPLASRGVAIVSGLAYGVDAEAHRAALAVHGRTIAVLGSGVDDTALYPRAHRQLAADIVAAGGVVMSEYAPGTKPQGYFFPQRNRIIAGLSRAVIVVEADEKSGALITAKSALEENRDVFAVPGPITSPLSRGTNALLREGAAPALSAESVFQQLELDELLPEKAEERNVPQAPDDNTGRILAALSGQPLSIDDLVQHSTLPPHVVASLLTVLELDGRVRDVGGKHYVRV